MLDRFILKTEEKKHYLLLIFISFFMTLVIGYINSFIGKNSLFLVSLISLALAYPITNYARNLDRKMIEEFGISKNFFTRYKKELLLFWSLFIGVFLGFLLVMKFGLVTDFTYQKKFVDGISGNIVNFDNMFLSIFFNNLNVGFFTFIISFLVFSGLIFILIWNASILAYFVYNTGGFREGLFISIALLSHGLLEIGGYIFAGIAGAILALRIDFAYSNKVYKVYNKKGDYKVLPDRRNTFSKVLNKKLFLDCLLLIGLSFVFILVAAVIEVL